MKHIVKITFSLILTGILMALAACTPDTRQAAATAAEIADFELPAGYTADFSVAMSGYSAVAYSPGDAHSHLYLVQSSQPADGAALEKGLADLVPGSRDTSARMVIVENRRVTVRGQAVTAVISEGINSENIAYRQLMAAFQGKGGPALLALSTPVATWDEAMVDALLASIR